MTTIETDVTTVTVYSGACMRVTVYTVIHNGYVLIRTTSKSVAQTVYARARKAGREEWKSI